MSAVDICLYRNFTIVLHNQRLGYKLVGLCERIIIINFFSQLHMKLSIMSDTRKQLGQVTCTLTHVARARHDVDTYS